jgi:hypothetical protein
VELPRLLQRIVEGRARQSSANPASSGVVRYCPSRGAKAPSPSGRLGTRSGVKRAKSILPYDAASSACGMQRSEASAGSRSRVPLVPYCSRQWSSTRGNSLARCNR